MQSDSYRDAEIEISIRPNPYNDRFQIQFDTEAGKATITRLDADTGWGQDLHIICKNKLTNKTWLSKIGPSHVNQVCVPIENNITSYISFKTNPIKLDHLLGDQKIYIGMSTIPSRISNEGFFKNIENLLNEQTYPVEKIFITIANKYKRLNNTTIDSTYIKKLEKYNKVDIIITDDYGPASKYLGPCEYKLNEIQDGLLCIIDDDWFYSNNLLKHFILGFKLYPDIIFAGGDSSLYFSSNYHLMNEYNIEFEVKNYNLGFEGFYGFCLRPSKMLDIIKFHKYILDSVDGAFFHDDAMIRAYTYYKNENMLMLKHKSCINNYISSDALCYTSPINRLDIEQKILLKTYELLKQNINFISARPGPPQINQYTYRIYDNSYSDTFSIDVCDDSLLITRLDINSGWGQDLAIVQTDLIDGKEQIIHIGASSSVSKKINLKNIL